MDIENLILGTLTSECVRQDCAKLLCRPEAGQRLIDILEYDTIMGESMDVARVARPLGRDVILGPSYLRGSVLVENIAGAFDLGEVGHFLCAERLDSFPLLLKIGVG